MRVTQAPEGLPRLKLTLYSFFLWEEVRGAISTGDFLANASANRCQKKPLLTAKPEIQANKSIRFQT